jgi:hypothetical protein
MELNLSRPDFLKVECKARMGYKLGPLEITCVYLS